MLEIIELAESQPLVKRTWHYIQEPNVFEVAPCACGNAHTQWSEYARHLWCEKCQIDFVPSHAGIFDGPIPVNVAAMLGVRFDRMNLLTGNVERFDIGTAKYIALDR